VGLLAAALLVPCGAGAVPDLTQPRQAAGFTVYPDDHRPGLFYYGPGELGVVTDAHGRPDLHFLQARYTGTAAAGDQGKLVFRSVLSLRVAQLGVGPQQLAAARQALALGTAELRPLPIQRLEAALVYAPVSAPAASAPSAPAPPTEPSEPAEPGAAGEETGDQTGGDQAGDQAAVETALPDGHFEGEGSAAGPNWSSRTYTLSLDPEDAQLLWDSLHKGRLVLSFGYAFFALGSTTHPASFDSVGGGKLGAELRRQVGGILRPVDARPAGDGSKTAQPPPQAMVRAGATAVTVDAQRWPELFRQVDVNESLPPGYAALDVYCYDFNNALRPDLYEKQVEIEAQGVGGHPVALVTSFQLAQPDLYARGLRFPLAVRLDRPYRYRVTEVGLDGATHVSPWTAVASWGRILDVTTQPAAPAPGASRKEP
jgi:hypothetical protein